MMGYVYILATLVLTTYGQLILKWRLHKFGPFPAIFSDQVKFFIAALTDVYILSSFLAAFLASLTWIATLTKFNLSYAYPFMSLSFILVLLLSYYLFNEPLKLSGIAGALIIIAGLYIASR
jgi:drug/metabolite transporter (DMT)-like permease